jgi:hypothetical protein
MFRQKQVQREAERKERKDLLDEREKRDRERERARLRAEREREREREIRRREREEREYKEQERLWLQRERDKEREREREQRVKVDLEYFELDERRKRQRQRERRKEQEEEEEDIKKEREGEERRKQAELAATQAQEQAKAQAQENEKQSEVSSTKDTTDTQQQADKKNITTNDGDHNGTNNKNHVAPTSQTEGSKIGGKFQLGLKKVATTVKKREPSEPSVVPEFDQVDEEPEFVPRKKRVLVVFDQPEDANSTDKSSKANDVIRLIQSIPTETEQVFAYEIDWKTFDKVFFLFFIF